MKPVDALHPALATSEHLAGLSEQVTAGSPAELRPLALVAELCAALEKAGVRYCHWKSNEALNRSASGDNDLDLLVSGVDSERLIVILSRLGFKQAQADRVHESPGIVDYYGLDSLSGRLVHAHVHYRLIVGHDKAKNYHLPVEDAYVASAVQGPLFRVPTPEFELIVFAIRMVLKHATWDSLLTLEGALSRSERQEWSYLTGRANDDRVGAVLTRHFPFVDPALFQDCMRALHPESSKVFRVRTAHRLQRCLAPQARRAPARDTALRLWRRLYWRSRRFVFHHPVRNLKRLQAGGAVIAVVGGDGSGKSSVVDGLYRCFSHIFVTRRLHLGKPKRSFASLLVKSIVRSARLFAPSRKASPLPATSDGSAREGAWLLWQVMIGRDRYRAYLRSRRLALGGAIVICDRYPLPQLELMDSARLFRFLEGRSRIVYALARLEERYYDRILPPDVLVVLRVQPETAAQRRPDEALAMVRARSQEVWDADWTATPALVVDADRPLVEVISEIKALVWQGL